MSFKPISAPLLTGGRSTANSDRLTSEAKEGGSGAGKVLRGREGCARSTSHGDGSR